MSNNNHTFGFLNSFTGQVITVTVALLLPILSWVLKSHVDPHPLFPPLRDNDLNLHLRGKDILIVGGTEGIGAALAHELVRRGSVVTISGASKANVKYLPKEVEYIHSNTSTMRGAQELGQSLQGRRFDTVVFAGGFVPRPLIFTKGEGAEEDLQTTYISRFIVLQELIKNDAFVGRKRVYILAYPGDDPMMSDFEDMWFGWTDYNDVAFHIHTIIFNDALIKEAAKRYPDLKVFGVNPGFITRGGASDIQFAEKNIFSRALERFLTLGIKSPEYYVRHTLVQILASPDLEFHSGAYISDKCEELPPKRWMKKEENRIKVWENSEKLVFKALG